jgi:Asp-tRNA(Asn)/Glu-tRNA(Gln) amidotransferase A subunit family amidase
MLPLAPTFDAVGWLTRDVSTSLRIARTLLPGFTGNAPRRTLALPAVERWAAPDVADACAARRSTAVRDGALPPLHEVALDPETLESWFHAFRTLQAREAWHAHGSWVTGNPGALGADVASRFGAAARITAAEAEDAAGTVDGARRELRALLADAVLVLPSSAGGAPATDASTDVVEAERAGTVRMTCLAGLAGAPAVSLPLLRTGDGRPVGLCLVGAPATDLGLLELAQRLAARTRAGDRA